MSAGRPLSVLVVEDELGMRELLVYELSAKGFEVTTACDGVEGLARLAAGSFDAVVTDLRMPRMGGMETLRAVKAVSPRTRVVMVTAHGTVETAVSAMKGGAVDFVSKPFDVDALARLLRDSAGRGDEGLEAGDLSDGEASRQLCALAAGVCHELGNGLACIEGYAQLLLEEGGLSAGARESLETIASHAARCGTMTEDLMALGRPARDEEESFPLAQALGAALRLCRYDFKKERVELDADLSDRAAVRGDMGRLQQVFLNLVRNAVESMAGRERRVLTARVERAGGRVRAVVGDTGAGVSPEHAARLFEPFFTTKGRAGTGLGLFLSRQIAARHGGTLTLEPAPAGGARAVLDLPAAP